MNITIMHHFSRFFSLFSLLFCSMVSFFAQYNGYGNGSSGDLTVTGIQTINYYKQIQITTASSVTLANLTNFPVTPNSALLLINMQTGHYEVGEVSAVVGTTVSFSTPMTLLNQFATFSQAVILPQYLNLTVPIGASITCPDWNGQTGGVIGFLVANNLTLSGGTINASGKGFLGGNGATGGTAGAGGLGGYSTGNNSPNGGLSGQGGSSILGIGNPGYGGAQGGLGLTGGLGNPPTFGAPGGQLPCGATVPACNASPNPGGRLYMGDGGRGGNGGNGKAGAGGGGSLNPCIPGENGENGGIGGNGGNGGRGGGIVYMRGMNVLHTGTQILVNGIQGTAGSNGTNGGQGGDGSCGGGGGDGADGGDGGAGGNGGAGGAIKLIRLNGGLNIPLLGLAGGAGGTSGLGGLGGLGGLNSSEDSCVCSPASNSCFLACYFDTIMKYIMLPNTTMSTINGQIHFVYSSNDTIIDLTYQDLGSTNCPPGFLAKLQGPLMVDSVIVCTYSTLIYSPNNNILSCLDNLSLSSPGLQIFPDSIVYGGCILMNGCYSCSSPPIIEQPENGENGTSPPSFPGGPGYYEQETGCVAPSLNPVMSNMVFCGCASIPLTGFFPPGTTFETNIGFVSNNTFVLCDNIVSISCMPSIFYVEITPVLNNCPGATVGFTVQFAPYEYTIVPGSMVVCSGDPVSATFSSSCFGGSSYVWSNSNTAIGLAGMGTGNGINFIASNTTNAPISATVYVSSSNPFFSCGSNLAAFNITVYPIPVVNPQADITICSGGQFPGTVFTSSVVGTNFTWSNSNPGIGLPASGTGMLPGFIAPNVNAPQSATITVTPTYSTLFTSCTGSPITFTITVNPSIVGSITTVTACDSYSWNGQLYTSSGAYEFMETNSSGCTVIDSLYLTLGYSSSQLFTETACDVYNWNGQLLNTSGTYTNTTYNSFGCPIEQTLLLTINNTSSSSISETACGNFAWFGQTLVSSGQYTHTLPNAQGCDSVINLQLTILPSSVSIDTVYSCSVNLPQTDTLMFTNQFGCDSLVLTTLVPPPASWYPNAAFQLTPSLVLYPEYQTTVINFSNENLSHQWFLEGEFWTDTTGNFVISASDIGSYAVTLVVSDTLNCTDTLVQYFQIIPDLLLHVPNAFTPNGDEFNQVFLPIFSDPTLVSDYQLLIFNRWNRIIFESNNQYVGWNGIYKERLVPNDTYTWIVTYTSKVTNERKEVIGHVSVVR